MFRRTTASTLQHLKRVNFKNPKLLQFHHPTLNCLVFVRNESTGIGNFDTIVSPVQNPAIPEFTPIIEEVVVQLAANGEPTLASLGLGSWWPSGLVQQALEILHCNVGLPWWGAIALGTVIVRAALFPLVLQCHRNAAKMNNHMPQIEVLQMKMTEARNTGDHFMAAKYSCDLMAFMVEKGITPFKQMLVPLAMAPVFVSCFLGLSDMADLPVESLTTGGMLWFVDLTVPDPLYLLPIITSTTLWATLELGTDEDGVKLPSWTTSEPAGPLIKYAVRAIPVIVFPVITYFPAALLCYWASTNAVSLAQVAVLKIPEVRTYFNIEPLLVHPAEDLPVEYKDFMKTAKESWTKMKISKEMEARERYHEDLLRRAGRAPINKTFKYDSVKASGGAVQAKQK